MPWPRSGDSWRPGAHPCKRAYDALREAAHSPEVVKSYGLASLPDITSARKEVKRLSGESYVPVLVLDDGEVIKDSKEHRGLGKGEHGRWRRSLSSLAGPSQW